MPSEKNLLESLKKEPEKVGFDDVISVVGSCYHYAPTAFVNGKGAGVVKNIAGQNEGSCKIFGFAKLHQLTADQTLHCFGDYYRKDVLENPEGSDHQNIRTFIQHGWEALEFGGCPLVEKAQ